MAGPSARRRGHARRAPDALPGRRGDGLGARPAGPGRRVHAPQRGTGPASPPTLASRGRAPPAVAPRSGARGSCSSSWLLHQSPETADLLTLEIAANVGNETNELLWGSPGTMLASAAMIERGGEERFAELWSRSAAQLLSVRDPDGCWTQSALRRRPAGTSAPATASPETPTPCSAGPICSRTRPGLRAGFARIALDQAIGTHETANWPPHTGGPLQVPDQTIRVQWCHGAPGIVTALAARRPRERRADARSWSPAGSSPGGRARCSKGAGLCHGTAGNASRSSRSFTARATSAGWSGRAPSRCTPRPRSRAHRPPTGAAATRSGPATSGQRCCSSAASTAPSAASRRSTRGER